VTTASDVYSLGVVLFKVLTERLPYRSGEKTSGELQREITESAPALPSASAQTADMTSRLKGDLDNIVLKALSKEPERRYHTVEQFAADLRRFAEGQPVMARPATISYRAIKFYGRNKISVWAAALILITLCAGIVAALSQARAARAQARIASEARAAAELETVRARLEKDRAEKTSSFMQSFLNYANPHWSGLGSRDRGRTNFTVREALHGVVERMDTDLSDAPEVRADLHYTIGEVYGAAGERDLARRHFGQSLDLYRQVHTAEHPKVGRGLYYVSLFEPDTKKAELLLRQGVGMMRRTDPENINLPHMLQSLAERIASSARDSLDKAPLAEAEKLILEAKDLFTRHYGKDGVSTDRSLARLALHRGELAQAESMMEALLERYRRTEQGGFEHISALFDLGEVRFRQGRKAEAESLFRQASEVARRSWGANDPRFKQFIGTINEVRASAGK